MNKILEFHILQNIAPANLNRDDTGSPKDAIFGGYRRARVSSQSWKRATREYVRQLIHRGDLSHGMEILATRTQYIQKKLIEILSEKGRNGEDTTGKVITALGGLGIQLKDEEKSQYLLFLGNQEIQQIAEIIHANWEELPVAESNDEKKEKSKKDQKKEGKEAVSNEIKKALKESLNGGKAIDLALFGRMLADQADLSREAAAQIAHAISTHAVEREFDFYTAVDDDKPEDNAGAGMLGTVEFNSACYYRYGAIDLLKLKENIQGDTELALQGLDAFLRGFLFSLPTGKQNSFAAHNPLEYVNITIKENADPRNLANAFEKPVTKWDMKGDENNHQPLSLTEASIKRFEEKWKKLDKVFGKTGDTYTLNLSDRKTEVGMEVDSVDELLKQSIDSVKQILG